MGLVLPKKGHKATSGVECHRKISHFNPLSDKGGICNYQSYEGLDLSCDQNLRGGICNLPQ